MITRQARSRRPPLGAILFWPQPAVLKITEEYEPESGYEDQPAVHRILDKRLIAQKILKIEGYIVPRQMDVWQWIQLLLNQSSQSTELGK